MASHPTISAHSSMSVDDRLFDSLASLLPADVPPPSTHKSRTLLFTPQASGGLGVMNFSAQGSALYDVASAQAPWPPVKLRGADEDVVRFGLSSKQVGDALLAAMPLQPQIVGLHELNARADASRPWFAISPTTKYLRIDPAAWRLAFANYLRVAVDYPSFGNHDSTLDGSQTCHRCGGPYNTHGTKLCNLQFSAHACATASWRQRSAPSSFLRCAKNGVENRSSGTQSAFSCCCSPLPADAVLLCSTCAR
jgi:hypothetical protein